MLRLIEAEELKHILNTSKYYGTKAGNAFADMITECKTIEVRKKGKWNWVSFNIECSECGAMPNFDSTEPLYNFCPNCGADMREEKEDG